MAFKWDWKTGFAGSAIDAIFGDDDDSRVEGVKLPEFEEDPDYRETQDFLKELGIDILGGDIPDYFAPIGETGGKEFEDFLQLGKGDISESILEGAAATGRGGGAVESMINEAIGEFSTKARYADRLRALEGRGKLLDVGTGITERVRGAGQTQQQQKNLFNLNIAGKEIGIAQYLDEFDASQDFLSGENMGQLLSMATNAAAGYATGGPVGAVAGAMGGSDISSIFDKAKTPSKTSTVIDPSKRIKLGKIGSDFNIEELLNRG